MKKKLLEMEKIKNQIKKIKLSKKGKIVGVVALILLVFIGFSATSSKESIDVNLYTIEEGIVKDEIVSDGKIDSNSMNTIYSLTTGEITELTFDIGDKIEVGDIVAKINVDNVYFQLEGIEAQISNLNYMLKEALQPADRAQVNNLELAIASAKAGVDRSNESVEKFEILYENGATSLEELNQIKDQNLILRNQLGSLRNDLAFLRKSVSSNVKLQYDSQIQALEANKKIILNALLNSDIKSKVAGIVTEKYIEEGQYIMQGAPIIEVTNMSELRVIADILESEINDIFLDMDVLVEDIFKGEFVSGEIVKIYPKIYEEYTELGIKQKKVNVEIKPDELTEGYLLNQKVDIKFIVNQREKVVRIPVDSYFTENDKKYVFINSRGFIATREVVLGIIGDDYVQVIEGLKIGDEIVETLENDIEIGIKIK